jgi:hypothetical protein
MSKRITAVVPVLVVVLASSSALAASLTPAGIAQGFTLSTFVDQIPNNGQVGPVGIGFPGSNQVMISGYANGTIRVFSDSDGQHYSAGALGPTNYGSNNAAGLTTLGGKVYLALQASGRVDEVNADGSFNHQFAGSFPGATGIVGNPSNGHLYVSNPFGGGTIWEVNPLTGLAIGNFGGNADGLTLSADNMILYAEVNDHILGYDLINPAHPAVFDSGAISGADGVALGTGTLAGKMFVNTNFGQVVQVDIATHAQTVIMTGGTRGDLVNVDPFNGTLLLTQTAEVLRLTPPSGGGFEGSGVPLPGAVSAGLALFALLGCGSLIRSRRQAAC